MFRFMNLSCRIGNRMNILSKMTNGALMTTTRPKVIAVQDNADPQVKAEALKDLREVVAFIGRTSAETVATGPVFDEAWVKRAVSFFERPNIDSWEIRRGIHMLCEVDCIPEPCIMIAVFKACKRLNDYALAIRFQESVFFKCGEYKEIWPYIMQEVKPTMDELGIDTLEALGYHKPELAVLSVDDIH